MSEKINASQFPRVFYCRHMQPGICKYDDETVLVDTDAIKQMMPSAIGKPVYIHHHEGSNEERLKNLKEEAVGYVTESFYNEMDGWAWFKFLAIDDECHRAVERHWSVSNAYIPGTWGSAGTKNNCPYNRQIMDGEFTHLAIVPNPRYEDAVIMSPDQFKTYQETKKRELVELQNSKAEPAKGKSTMFKLFKTKREEVSSVDADTQIELESGQIVTVGEMMNSLKTVSDAEKAAKAEKEKKNAKKNEKEDDEEMENAMVDCDGEKMPVKELINRYSKMKANEKKNADEAEDKKKADKEAKEKENAEDEKKKKDSDEEAEKANSHFRELQNAHMKDGGSITPILETSMDMLARGKARYGSATK